MWTVRFLKGPNVGQTIQLKKGENKVGRGDNCQVRLQSQGISKEHAVIKITDKEIVLHDLNSRNGTFVNGTKVRIRPLKMGDRISFHDVILELADENALMLQTPSFQGRSSGQAPMAYDGNAALNTHMGSPSPAAPSPQSNANTFLDSIKKKFEELVLPAILQLSQTFEYRWVIGSFVLIYVVLVTTLSVIPMMRITQTSIEKESQRRATTIAQGLADRYKISLVNGTSGSFETRFAEREEGVTAAFILSAADGSIIAPVSRTGAYAEEPFVHTARKKDEPLTQQIDSSTIGASIPIPVYDQETGLLVPKAYAMVIYNMGSLAIDSGRLISLFSQVLGIAILAGLLLFVFLYRIIEAPISGLTQQLDNALKDSTQKVESPYDFATLQNLVLNINSALARGSGSSSPSFQDTNKDIYSEAMQLVRIMMNPAFAIDNNGIIIAVNSSLSNILNIPLSNLEATPLSSFPDEAIIVVANELIQRAQSPGGGFISSPIHFNHRDLELNVQPVRGPKGIEYMILTLTSVGGEPE